MEQIYLYSYIGSYENHLLQNHWSGLNDVWLKKQSSTAVSRKVSYLHLHVFEFIWLIFLFHLKVNKAASLSPGNYKLDYVDRCAKYGGNVRWNLVTHQWKGGGLSTKWSMLSTNLLWRL